MKNNSKLFQKRIALENCQVNGGRAMGTQAMCSKYTYGDHCADKTTAMYDDKGNSIGPQVTTAWQTD
ncbi:hypothetical protein C7T94_08355 [Pedobacter yulinensis]|uniref:Uncharacterized protein n=1 Tax=Pedobacter yulinensis TaxID=2126353 RepID=A0A2T3HJU5_9SPHI|nr:hypothetical protein [Pedobacter yulinensis]PST82663.1 hypothetical protein C7T94_08355 [Pedobacter yulinensis]